MGAFRLSVGAVLVAMLAAGPAIAEPLQIKINWTSVADDVLYVMQDRPGILKHHGKVYTVEWLYFKGAGPEIIKAMMAGLVDGGTTDLFSFARGITKGDLDVKIVAQVMGERPGSFASTWVALKDSGIRSPKHLKGKTIAVRAYGDVSDTILNRILKRAGLDPVKDVKKLEIPFPVALEALNKGRIDVALLPQPFYTIGHGKVPLVDVMSFRDALPRHELLAFAFRTEFFKKHPEVVKAFLEDYVVARRFLATNRAEAVESTARITKLPRPMIEPYLFTEKDYYRHPDSVPDVDVFREVFDFMFEERAIERRLDVRAVVDLTYHPRGR